ncbi:MAG TPA: hypothetical protein VMZ53_10930 [Kofleriaceae bacterium]|nr:hypothetical protein [Kofleriaceae bacterium]
MTLDADAAKIPSLIEHVAAPKVASRWEELAQLGDLACGGDHEPYIFTGYSGGGESHTAVAAGHATYLKVLAGKDAKARAAAAFVLAWLPEHAKKSLAALHKVIKKEKDATARASMILALAVLAPGADLKLDTEALGSKEAPVSGAGLVAAAIAGQLPAKATFVAPTLARADTIGALCWQHGDLGTLVMRAVLHASSRDNDATVLTNMIFAERGYLLLPDVIKLLFPSRIEAAKLTKPQRELLDKLTLDPTRYGYAQLPKLWEERGLPTDAEAARAQLGLTEVEEPLEEIIAVGRGKKTFAEHLAEAVADPERRKPLAVALAKENSAREVVELCVEGCTQEEGPDFQDTVVELFEACGPDLVPALRELDIYKEVQLDDGRAIQPTQLAAPALLLLARRDPALPDDKLDQLWAAASARHLIEPILAALPPDRRARKLADAYRNVPSWEIGEKTRLEKLMLAAPAPELTAELLAHVKELKDAYANGRKMEGTLFSEGYSPAKLKKLKPRAHPLTPKLIENIEAYAHASDDKQLGKAIAQFLDM